MTCVVCNGKGKVSKTKARAIKHAEEIWCSCENSAADNVTYHHDTPRMKHHWTCNDCGKVVQIG